MDKVKRLTCTWCQIYLSISAGPQAEVKLILVEVGRGGTRGGPEEDQRGTVAPPDCSGDSERRRPEIVTMRFNHVAPDQRAAALKETPGHIPVSDVEHLHGEVEL